MQTFPVTNSTLSASHLAPLLIDIYALPTATTCSILKTGINDSYLVQAGAEKYVLRVYSYGWRSEEEIQEELSLLRSLSTGGIPVSWPVAATSGALVQHINAPEGLRYAVLFSFVEGGKIRNMSEDRCFKIGEIIGAMHQHTENMTLKRVNYDMESLMRIPYQIARSFFDESMDEMQLVRTMTEEIAGKFERAGKENLRYGIVHLDIWYDNMSITEESEISLFDFDFCGNGPLLLDIAYFLIQLFNIESDKAVYERKKKYFLEGYKSRQFVSVEELELLPYMAFSVWIFYLGVQASRFDNWSNLFFTENYLRHFIGIGKNWLLYHDAAPDLHESAV